MSRLQSWLPKSWNLKSRKPQTPLKRRSNLLQVLPLEDRVTPANFVVSNLLDAGGGSFRQAVLNANGAGGADTISFSVGAGTIALSSEVAITDAVSITGSGHTLSTGSAIRLIITDGAATNTAISFANMNFTNGRGGFGGAIFVGDENLTLTGCSLSGNSASTRGGAIYLANPAGTINLNSTTITNNTAASSGGGGGICIYNGGSLVATNSAITNNKATGGTGGGLYFWGAVGANGLNVVNSTISNNSASDNGGGIVLLNMAGTMNFTGGTLSGNTARNGGGLFADSGGTAIVNSTISGNFANGAAASAYGNGGGVDLTGGTHTMTGTTVSGNKANREGGGIRNSSTLTVRNATVVSNTARADNGALGNGGGFSLAAGTTTIFNTIVAGNIITPGTPAPLDVTGSFAGGSINNLIGDAASAGGLTNGVNGNIVGAAVGSVINTTLANNGGPAFTHALAAASPALNAGSNASTGGATTDGRGTLFTRTNGVVDIGAYETQSISPVVSNGGDANDFNFTAGQLTLREAIQQTNANPGADAITFSGNFTSTLATEIPISGAVTITGKGAGTIVSGNNVTRVFNTTTAAAATVITINDLTITGGSTTGEGGGIAFGDDFLTLNDCTITGSKGAEGGAIDTYESNGKLTINRCTLSGNTATGGGNDGGAVNIDGSNVTVTITDSTLSGNSSGVNGGGLYIFGGSLTVRNSTFSSNSATSTGGGIYAPGGTRLIENSTIVANSAGSSGGGIFANSAITITSSIVSGNTNAAGPDISSASTVNVNFSAIGSNTGFTPTGANNLPFGTNLKLRTLADNGGPTNTIAFEFDSPLRDVGSNPLSLVDDQRGINRTNGVIDIGAFELNTTVYGTGNSGTNTLRAAVTETNRVAGADTITFDSTTFNAPQTITLGSGLLSLTGSVTITGPAQPLTISGNSTDGIFRYTGFTGSTFNISNVTLTKGNRTFGSAIELTNETLNLTNVTVSGNSGGPAIRTYVGPTTLTNVTITGNSGTGNGGGIDTNGKLTVINSVISNNTAANGAGIYVGSTSGAISILGSSITGNSASSQGGGIRFDYIGAGNSMTITNTTISGNKAADGGGIRTSGVFGTINLFSSTITNNSVSANGGGINTFSNVASTFNVESSIISGNIDADSSAPDFSNNGFSSITVNRKNSAIGSTGDLTSVDQGGNLAFGTNLKLAALSQIGSQFVHLPAVDSPVRDAGSNPGAQSLDQRGNSRTWGGQSDIGSVELDPDFIVRNVNNAGVGSLRQQVLDANAFGGANTITFSSLFNAVQTIPLTTGPLNITQSATITGPGATLLTVSGSNLSNVFTFGSGTHAMSGVTVSGGGGGGSGGGINNSGTLTLSQSAVRNNSANDVAGIYNSGVITIDGCTIANNTTPGGGAGIGNFGTATILNSTINNNSGTGNGGGIYNGGPMTITGSTIANNTVAGGAGSGGGIHNQFGTLTLRNTTIAGNSAGVIGGGVRIVGGTVTIDGSIVSYNTNAAAPDVSSGASVSVNKSAIGSTTGFTISGTGNLVGQNLKLRTLASNGGPTQTLAFDFDSPLRNVGSNLSSLTLDPRGLPRNDGGGVDIGAFELNTLVTNTLNTGVGSLRDAVAEVNRVNGADTITFDSSFNSKQTITLTTGGELAFAAAGSIGGVTVAGPGAGLLTISGNNASRIFNTSPGNIAEAFTFNGMTLTAATTAGDGGAITSGDEVVTVNDSVISNSKAFDDGAAIYTNTGTIIVNRTTLTGNTSTGNGGALYNENSGASIQIYDSTLSSNSGGRGGAVTFFGNIGAGGFIIRNSTLANNTANSGGGAIALVAGSGTLFVQNSTITGNSTTNSSSSYAGAITENASFTISIESSVVSGNFHAVNPDILATVVNATKSAIGSLTGWTFGSGSGNLTPGIDLKLGALADNGGPMLTVLPAIDSPLRGAGSNPAALTTDQRGFARTDGVGNLDIGAVQVRTTTVNSMTRVNPNPTALASVQWTVKTADSLTGVTSANFTLSGGGATGASITTVTGSGTTYTVTAATGNDGDLTLNFANSTGLSLLPSNLPFAGQTYFVNKVALAVTGITTSDALLTDSDVGPAEISFTATYNEAMDTSVNPTFTFPVEAPGAALSFSSGTWTTPTTFVGTYNVADLNLSLANIDVRVNGGKDTGGNVFTNFTQADLFGIDTKNPVAASIARVNPTANNLASVSWTVTFTESVTGLTLSNFSLFNGGLTGSPALTTLSGSGTTYTVSASTGSGVGTLGLYVDNAIGVIDANGNPLAGTPVVGGAYNIDHVSPRANNFSTNTIVVSDANVGPNGFTATVHYDEQMNTTVQPVASFPVEPVVGSLTFASGTWLDGYTWQAKYNVADAGIELNNIDFRVAGGVDLVGNTQDVFDAVDLFRIDTLNPVTSSITSTTANGTYGVGAPINVTLNFNESVTLAGGNLLVTLDTGAVVTITPFTGTTASGTYTVGAGQNSADLNVTAINLGGGATLRDSATNNAVLTLPVSNLAVNKAIVINTGTGPNVVSFSVNNGDTQRSRITSVKIQFDGPVTAANFNTLGAIQLKRTAVSSIPTGAVNDLVQTGPAAANHITVAQTGATALTLTFDNNGQTQNNNSIGVESGSLTDGYWQLIVGGFSSTVGDLALRRLYGDSTNGVNGTIDGSDLSVFGNAFNTSNTAFDFNNDGSVDGSDLSVFGNRFGNVL